MELTAAAPRSPCLPRLTPGFRRHRANEVHPTARIPAWRRGSAAVVGLVSLVGPAAVLRRVMAVIVDAIDRVRRGGLAAHISEEGVERVQPLVTDRDASASISREFRVPGVQASLLHRRPTLILGCVPGIVPAASVSAPAPFTSNAATGSGVSAGANYGLRAAVAPNLPVPRAAWALVSVRKGDVRQSALSFTGSVSRHRAHAAKPIAFTGAEWP